VEAPRTRYSRFQVLTHGEPAWVTDPSGERYAFDGLRFWHLRWNRPAKLRASWQAPSFGWVHSRDCLCALCAGAFIAGPARTRPRPEQEQSRVSA
jgi:hypothetical protein